MPTVYRVRGSRTEKTHNGMKKLKEVFYNAPIILYTCAVPIYTNILCIGKIFFSPIYTLLIHYNIPTYYSKPLSKPPRVRRAHNVCAVVSVRCSWSKKVTPKVKPCASSLMILNDARERNRRARPAASRMTWTRYNIFSSVQVYMYIVYLTCSYLSICICVMPLCTRIL